MSDDGDRNASLGRCGSYELLVELAAGGMATVFLARKTGVADAHLVAVKRPHRHLQNDKGFLTMLVDEARLASSIDHDHVVKVRELGFEGGEPFIVMDYVEGSSLADIRKELSAVGRAIDPRFAVRIALDALAGLQAAHVLHDDKGRHLGIVHRDVSPHNVLIGCDGLSRITDFGIAKAADRVQATRTHEVKGKLAYLAPERIDKRRICTVQSDVFSMAVVLWECIAGRRLFRGEEAIETLQEVVAGPIPSLRKIGVPISEGLDDAILRGLSRDLEVRFKTAAEFAAALESASGAGRGGARDGAGARGQIATHAEVAMLVEALFGDRLRVRHEQVREALPREQADTILEVSGLNRRPAPTPEMRERERIAIENIAPPAPSARYTFGAASEKLFSQRFGSPRVRYAALAASVGLLTALVVLVVVTLRKPPASSTVPVASAADVSVRRVIVPLPFTATRVTFDDQTRDLAPPSDVVAFEVPRSAGVTHRVTALAVDGSRAEAYVREADGVARPEGQGFAIEPFEQLAEDNGAPSSASAAYIELPPTKNGVKRVVKPRGATRQAKDAGASAAASAASPKPIGSVKDGFTKLR
ncbi:MAG: serine/threonine protein kinase [Deltaproteobacteria bacterium]|nr:serine/threonine protein kinase [Deltaproteobacteria bacterium]